MRVKAKVKVTLRQSVSRPVRLGIRRPSGTRDRFFFLLENVFKQLQVCYFVAPFLMRGRVCNILLLLVLARAAPLGSSLSDERSGLSLVIISQYVHKAFTKDIYIICVWHSSGMYIQYMQGLFQSRLGTADDALVTSSLRYHGCLGIRTVDRRLV
jgi:hypothetical protein